jgi:Arc/MetJ-type ribon-helix-helix transcriptional regulator
MQNFAYALLMSTIRLTPHSEELLQKQLTRGPYRSPEEVIERALETLAQKESTPIHPSSAAKSPAEAVADILEIQKRKRLGGLKIKDLIHEGHKY